MVKQVEGTYAGVLELHWASDNGITCYELYERNGSGQMTFVEGFEQGPFDTALEVSQWAWKRIAERVRPSHC
jgi:hypothetical protein